MSKLERYIFNTLIVLDCAVDTVFFGSSPYETLSSRCWRHREHWAAAKAVKLIDWLAYLVAKQKDHCMKSEQSYAFYRGLEVWN